MRNKSSLGREPHCVPDRGQGHGFSIRKQVDNLLLRLQPTAVADERRRAVFDYVQDVVQQHVPDGKIFPVGSFPLKTYLPYADLDMVMFSPPRATSTSRGVESEREIGTENSGKGGGKGIEREGATDSHPLGGEGRTADEVRTPALVAVNQALCTVAARAGSKRGSPSSYSATPEIRNVSFINARTPIVKLVVGNIVVDITENQAGSVAASALLEEADNLIQRDHIFKRSLLLLKAWAWCETPRLVGQRVLGAQNGGLTSYGLSVMVLHLFALRTSQDTLVHPIDVFIRFFEVYSEFDWGRYCLTLDGPVPFESVRVSRPCEGSQGNVLIPLVRRVLAELYPAPEKEHDREREKAKEKDKDKAGRRGRRASRLARVSDGHVEDLPLADGEATRSATRAAPHFPRRDCNIQDPLNALNNLGHSMTKSKLKALKRALQQERQRLEAWQLVSRALPPRSRRGGSLLRRSRETQEVRSGRSQGGRGVEGRLDIGRFQAGVRAGGATADGGVAGAEEARGPRAEDRKIGGEEHNLDPYRSPELAAPVLQRHFSAPCAPHHFGPPAAQHVLLAPLPQHAAHPSASVLVGPSQPTLVPIAHLLATRERHPAALAFPQPFLQVVPHQHQHVHQPQPYVLPQQPGMLWPSSAMLVPVARVQGHVDFSRQLQWQWQWQRHLHGVFAVANQGNHQVGSDQQRMARMNSSPVGWVNQVTASSDVPVAGRETETRPKSAPQAQEGKGSPADRRKCRGARRKRPEESHDLAMQGPMLPWDLPEFANASATSSTASLSDFVEDGSKGEQDCQLQYESGADDRVCSGVAKEKENRFASWSDGSDEHSEAMMDTRHQERGEGQGVRMKRASGNSLASSFLAEFFPGCCQRYGSGDGFREDLLDHPCQRRSNLQEPGSPPPRGPDAPDVLQGASGEMWTSLKAVGEMMRGLGSQTNGRSIKETEAEPGTETRRAAMGADGVGQGGERGAGRLRDHVGHEAGVEQRVAQVRRAGVVSPACTGGDQSAPTRNTGGDARARAMEVLRPKQMFGDVDDDDRTQRRDGDRPTADADTAVRPQVSVDDETGYTTSEEQGDREDPNSCGGESREDDCDGLHPIETPSPAKLFPVSTSTQMLEAAATGCGQWGVDMVDRGVQCPVPEDIDRGVQCLSPTPKVMVSSSSQLTGPARTSISTGVQCAIPAHMSRGSQCSFSASRQASTGVQCSPLAAAAEHEGNAAEKAQSAQPSPNSPCADAGAVVAEGCLADSSKDQDEKARDSNKDMRLRRGSPQSHSPLPSPGETSEATHVVPAAAPIRSSADAYVGDRVSASRRKKRRKKAIAEVPAGRSAAAESAVERSFQGWSKATGVGLGDWKLWLVKGVVFCGVVGLVLAVVLVLRRGPVEAKWQGVGLLPPRVAQEGQAARAQQAPVWVPVGGSLTLGDALASRSPASKENAIDGVLWFKGGIVLPGQSRPFLTISAASLEDEGTYACFAVEESGPIGRIGGTALWEATVRISEPPLVESQFQTQRLARGEMLAIIATASGVPQPEYQWRRNGVPIPGATRPMLVRHSVSEADVGTYTCDVYNIAGSAQWEEMAVILREHGSKRPASK